VRLRRLDDQNDRGGAGPGREPRDGWLRPGYNAGVGLETIHLHVSGLELLYQVGILDTLSPEEERLSSKRLPAKARFDHRFRLV
jgi:hypothetical protein